MYNSNVKFGDVAVGATVTYGVTLSNSGTAPLTLQQNSLSGAGFATTGVGQRVTLEPGQAVTLAVSFNPSDTGTANGMASLTSNTSNSAINLPLSGNGVIAGHSATLAWDASSSSVVGYNIYRSPSTFESWTKLNSSPVLATSYTDWDTLSGTSYLFMVSAVSASNVEGSSSPATLVAIPTP